MGIDILEFVLEVEDTFGLVLTEGELHRCDTIGALSALIWRRLSGGSDEGVASLWDCPNRVAFGRLRGARAQGAQGWATRPTNDPKGKAVSPRAQANPRCSRQVQT
jgi:hypothetical protein